MDRSLCPNCLHHSTNTLSASEKRTPLNFVQRTLPSPKHSLTIHNYLQKWTVKLHPPINRMLVDHFHKIECHCGWIQRPGITLRSSVTCRASLSHYRTTTERSQNVPHHAQQPKHTNISMPYQGVYQNGCLHIFRQWCIQNNNQAFT